MPITLEDVKKFAGPNATETELVIIRKIAEIYLSKVGEGKLSEIKDTLNCLGETLHRQANPLPDPGPRATAQRQTPAPPDADRVSLMLADPPHDALITTRKGIATAPNLPSTIEKKYVFEPGRSRSWSTMGSSSSAIAPPPPTCSAPSRRGVHGPGAQVSSGNGEVRGKGVYVGVCDDIEEVKHWANLDGKPKGTKPVVLAIFGRMGFMRGKQKPMAKFRMDPEPMKLEKFAKWDQKYDYVKGDINAGRGAIEIKVSPTAMSDLRMIVVWQGDAI